VKHILVMLAVNAGEDFGRGNNAFVEAGLY
jgi:hypothetical protein